MPLTNPIHPGEVVWTGENPGILLKESDDGPFSAIALFFRIYYSPVGRGTALLILEEPNDPVSLPKACNALICDSAELAAYIKKDFIEKANNGKRIIPTLDIDGVIYSNPGISRLMKIIAE